MIPSGRTNSNYNSNSNANTNSRYPFTASQWQELEHQALIYKYMASGIPIPSDLILPIRRSFLLDSTTTSPSLAFPPHPQWGWSPSFSTGFGRKAEDPEPGRCRRTDGKKWRCSKEAYPDSKYCERHMHRGKNRSRKPVEISLATKTNHFSSSSSSSSSSPSAPSPFPASLSISTPEAYPLLYHHPSPYSSRPSTDFLGSSSQLQLDSGLTYPESEYRFGQGVRGFFGDGSGVDWDASAHQFKSVVINNPGEPKQTGYSLSKEEEEERQRPLRHFFDEWPQRNRDPWMNMEEENGSCTKTRLSIAFPKWFPLLRFLLVPFFPLFLFFFFFFFFF